MDIHGYLIIYYWTTETKSSETCILSWCNAQVIQIRSLIHQPPYRRRPILFDYENIKITLLFERIRNIKNN